MEDRKPFTVVSCVITKGDQILLVQEGKESNYGQWNIPSGRLEYNEDIIAAVIREVLEETGCEVRIIGLLGIYTYQSLLHNHLINYNFSGQLINENIKFDGEEILNVKWFSFDELKKMDDNQFWNPQFNRKVFEDVKHENLYPNSIIKSFL